MKRSNRSDSSVAEESYPLQPVSEAYTVIDVINPPSDSDTTFIGNQEIIDD